MKDKDKENKNDKEEFGITFEEAKLAGLIEKDMPKLSLYEAHILNLNDCLNDRERYLDKILAGEGDLAANIDEIEDINKDLRNSLKEMEQSLNKGLYASEDQEATISAIIDGDFFGEKAIKGTSEFPRLVRAFIKEQIGDLVKALDLKDGGLDLMEFIYLTGAGGTTTAHGLEKRHKRLLDHGVVMALEEAHKFIQAFYAYENIKRERERDAERRRTPFAKVMQGAPLDILTQMDTSPKAAERYKDELYFKSGKNMLSIKGVEDIEAGLSVSAKKLLKMAIVQITPLNSDKGGLSRIVSQAAIPIKEYMELTGREESKANIDKVRRELKKDIETLRKAEIKFERTDHKAKTKDFVNMGICSAGGIYKGVITLGLGPEYVEQLNKDFITTYYPLNIFKLSKSSYYLVDKLATHFNMYPNIDSNRHELLSVKSLLESIPSIPSYDTVKRQGKSEYKRRIIEPFEKALEEAEAAGIIEWAWSNAKGEPLTEDQLTEDNPSFKYSAFIGSYIKFKILGVPEEDMRNESRARIESEKHRAELKKAREIEKIKKASRKKTEPKA